MPTSKQLNLVVKAAEINNQKDLPPSSINMFVKVAVKDKMTLTWQAKRTAKKLNWEEIDQEFEVNDQDL